jgi:3D (Asp-Asp-Asp) domain-containing protein
VLRGVYVGAAKTALESNGKARVVWLEVTGYCPCEKCCGPNAVGITASGKPVSYHDGIFAAADPAVLPYGTRVSVPGYHDGAAAEVIDKGSAIVGNRLDVFFPTHAEAEAWGRQWLAVRVEKD